MKLLNSFHTVSQDKPRWEKTADGFLRTRARLLAERVMTYGRQELAEVPDSLLDSPVVQMFVSKDTMGSGESLRSLEGGAVVAGNHNWLDPQVIKTYQVGQVAGTPVLDGPYLVADLLITCPATIADIEAGRLVDISAAYTADTIFEPGDFDGTPYDARQTCLRYNHVAILAPGEGRAGTDVRIINKNSSKEKTMDVKIVRVRLGNTGKFVNTDEEGAAAIVAEEQASKEAVVEAEAGSGKKLEELMTQVEDLNAQIAALQAEAEEGKGELSVYKEKLDELLSTEAIEQAAEGMVAESAEAEEIIENAAIVNEKGEEDESEKEKVMNSLKGLHGTRLHSAVLTAVGVKVENMSPEAIRGAFKAQHQITNAMRGKKTVVGAKLMNSMTPNQQTITQPVVRTSRERLGFK